MGCATRVEREMPEISVQNQEKREASMDKSIESYKLANGLTVFLIEKDSIPMATVMIAVRNGSFAEDESNNGLAHLYEHMFFKANEKIPSQPLFLRALDEMGIELGPNMNAYTSTESVRYFFTLQSQYLDRGLKFMADAVMTPKFLQDELEKERQVVIGEFDRYEASPNDVFFQKTLMKKLFEKHFVRKNVIGSRPVILSASQQQMHDIQHRYYIPNNSSLFIVGSFDQQKIRQWIEANFSSWQPGPNPFEKYPVPEHPALEKSESFNEEGPVRTVQLVKAYHGPKMGLNDRECIALDIASSLLGFQASPFQKELVESGLAAHAAFFSWAQRYTSPVIFSLETSPENAQKASDKLEDLIKRIRKPGFFSESDLDIAKTSIEVTSAYDRESGQRYALSLASVWTSTGSIDYYLNYVDIVKTLTIKDIESALAKYLSTHSVTGALIPKGSKPISWN